MFDAQTEIAKIINLIETRQEKLQELKLEMSQDEPDGAAMTKLYAELVRRSARIHTEIRVIKQLEKTLTRPFVFNGNMYDGDHMFDQMRRKRLQILELCPDLAEVRDLKMFMLPGGEISDTRKIKREDYELRQDEELWSSDSEEPDSETEDFNRLDEVSSLDKSRPMGRPRPQKLSIPSKSTIL